MISSLVFMINLFSLLSERIATVYGANQIYFGFEGLTCEA